MIIFQPYHQFVGSEHTCVIYTDSYMCAYKICAHLLPLGIFESIPILHHPGEVLMIVWQQILDMGLLGAFYNYL